MGGMDVGEATAAHVPEKAVSTCTPLSGRGAMDRPPRRQWVPPEISSSRRYRGKAADESSLVPSFLQFPFA
jgi:hypothetical protein